MAVEKVAVEEGQAEGVDVGVWVLVAVVFEADNMGDGNRCHGDGDL